MIRVIRVSERVIGHLAVTADQEQRQLVALEHVLRCAGDHEAIELHDDGGGAAQAERVQVLWACCVREREP